MKPSDIYRKCINGVVSIASSSATDSSVSSGFFIDSIHIVTCSHCVKKSDGSPETTIDVFADVPGGKITGVRVLGVDGVADVAVLELQHPIPGIAPLKWTSTVNRGDECILLGTPYGEMESISVGYVRDISFYGSTLLPPVMESILIDGSALGGNSGGPLLTDSGNVMGILAYGYNNLSGGFMNGAVSHSIASPIVSSILSTRRDYVYGTLGIKVMPLFIDDCVFLGLTTVQGYIVMSTSSQFSTGIQQYDIILDISIKGVKYVVGQLNSQKCIFSLIHMNAGASAILTILRIGDTIQLPIRIPSTTSTVPQSGYL